MTKILLAEDDNSLRTFLAAALRRASAVPDTRFKTMKMAKAL